jgi:deoxyadenosine/deoxycytidine kinase
VTHEQGKRLAEEMKAVFLETSAKDNQVLKKCQQKPKNYCQMIYIFFVFSECRKHFHSCCGTNGEP